MPAIPPTVPINAKPRSANSELRSKNTPPTITLRTMYTTKKYKRAVIVPFIQPEFLEPSVDKKEEKKRKLKKQNGTAATTNKL